MRIFLLVFIAFIINIIFDKMNALIILGFVFLFFSLYDLFNLFKTKKVASKKEKCERKQLLLVNLFFLVIIMIVITVNKEKFLKEREIKKLFDKSSITLNFRTMGAKNSEVENTKKSVNIDVYSSKELQKFNENQKKNGLSIYTEKQISGVTLKPWTNLAC